MFDKTFKDLRGGFALSHVWLYQAYHDISAKYRRTIFGSLWIAGQMVFSSLAFAIVYGALFVQDPLSVALPRIMAGLIAFALVGNYLFNESPEIYLINAGIISNHAYPYTYYNLESITRTILIFLHNFVVYEIVTVLVGAYKIPDWTLLIGLAVVIVNMLTWGSVVAMASTRFRDLRFLLPYLSQLVMFVTPILYDPSLLPADKKFIVDFNPVYPFVEMIRAPMKGTSMPMQYWPMALAITGLGIVVWFVSFNAFRRRIAFWV